MPLGDKTDQDSQDFAASVFQRHLDVVTKLVFAGEAEAAADHLALPYVFHTAAGEAIAETREDLIGDLLSIHAWLTSQNATDFYRIVHTARYLNDDVIEGTHVSYILRGALPVNEPYRSRTVLKRIDGHWRAAFSEHELADALHPARDTRPRPGIFLSDDGFGAEPVIHDTARALPIYLTQLDAMTDCMNERDFAAWIAHFADHYDVHYEGRDIYQTSPNQSQPFFDGMCAKMDECGAHALVRDANFAAFLSPDRILGYHTATMQRDGEVRFGPIQSRMILTHTDGAWRCSSVTNSLKATDFKGTDFKLSDHLPTLREIHERKQK